MSSLQTLSITSGIIITTVVFTDDVIITSPPQVDEVLLYSHHIDDLVGSLETCEYRQPKFREVLDKLQKMIDDLNLRSYSNLGQWVAELDRQVCPVSGLDLLTSLCVIAEHLSMRHFILCTQLSRSLTVMFVRPSVTLLA